MPNANRLTVGIMAMVAEEERRMISARTKAALAAAKARGTVLGGYRGTGAIDDAGRAISIEKRQSRCQERSADLAPTVADLRASGAASLRQIAAALNERGIPTARGGQWSAVQVKRMLEAA